MVSRAQRRWLEEELPALVQAGVLAPDAAERLRAHYAAEPGRSGAVPLFAVLGAGLIGLGVMLLLAANWEELGRGARTALCFLMLLAAQVAAGWALLRRASSTAWTEATGVGLSLAAAATIALVGQTWQTQGDLRSFLESWLLLTFPITYLLGSRGAAALYLVGAAGWLGYALDAKESTWGYWLILAGILPYLVSLVGRAEAPLRNGFLASVATPVIAFGAMAGFHIESAVALVLLWSLVTAGIYATGAAGRSGGAYYAAPSASLAGLALAWAALMLGYVGAWEFVGDTWDREGEGSWADAVGAGLVAGAFGLLWLVGAVRLALAGDRARLALAAFPLMLAAGIAATLASEGRVLAAVGANLFALGVGLAIALAGMAESNLRRANAGLLFLGALVFMRFSDMNLDYTLRGLVFIGFGVAFLLLNLRLRRSARGLGRGAGEVAA